MFSLIPSELWLLASNHGTALCSRDGARLDSIRGLLDVGLLFHLLLAGTMLHVSWSFGLRLFRVLQMEVLM